MNVRICRMLNRAAVSFINLINLFRQTGTRLTLDSERTKEFSMENRSWYELKVHDCV